MVDRSLGGSTFRFAGLAVAYVVFASIVTHLPLSDGTQRLISHFDKPLHFLLYAVMVVLLTLAMGASRLSILFAAGATLVMASLDEMFQAIVPSRQVELGDWIAGAAGTLFGALLMWGWLRTRAEKQSS